MFINLYLLIHNTINISLIQLNWFYFDVFLSNECNFFYFYSLFAILLFGYFWWSATSHSFLCCIAPHSNCCAYIHHWTWLKHWMNPCHLRISTACIFPFFFAQSKALRIANLPFSCSDWWPYFSHLSYVHITYFTPFHPIHLL